MNNLNLEVKEGEIFGLLGPNGAGKTSLIRIVNQIINQDQGKILLNGNKITYDDVRKIGYMPEDRRLVPQLTVRENILLPSWAASSGDDTERLDWIYLLLPEVAEFSERKAIQLSGGQQKLVALARALMAGRSLLLLDEPTNHLDAESIAWLEQFLKEFPGTVVAITHDRYFLDNAASWILELDRGYGIPYEGNYSAWLDAKEKRLEVEERKEAARRKSIKAELEWVRSQPKARQAKNKARLERVDELNSQEFQTRNETQELYIPPGPRLGDRVLEVNNVTKGFGEAMLIEDLSFLVPKGAIVGIIGGNLSLIHI